MLIQWLTAGLLALIGCGLVALHTPKRWRAYPGDRPQRFHAGDVSRHGGVALGLVFWSVGTLWACLELHPGLQGRNESVRWWIHLGLAVLPAWIIGMVEDATHAIRPRWRLLATLLSALLAVGLLDLRVNRIGVESIDPWLSEGGWLGILIPVVALVSLPHAVNFIDGYNGLASTVVLMVAAGMLYVALKVADWHLASVLVCLIGVTMGFWFWNYPRGMLFAGDGGAYFWGMVISIVSVALVQRNPEVSPWFPVLLLAYPIMEIIFSIYRKIARGQSPSVADALHFHQLIYRRLVRGIVHDDHARRQLMRNNRTSPYLWGVAMLAAMPAVLFWSNTPVLIVCFVLFVFLYVGAYIAVIRFKTPGWLRR